MPTITQPSRALKGADFTVKGTNFGNNIDNIHVYLDTLQEAPQEIDCRMAEDDVELTCTCPNDLGSDAQAIPMYIVVDDQRCLVEYLFL